VGGESISSDSVDELFDLSKHDKVRADHTSRRIVISSSKNISVQRQYNLGTQQVQFYLLRENLAYLHFGQR
jgi:hypothetical protein